MQTRLFLFAFSTFAHLCPPCWSCFSQVLDRAKNNKDRASWNDLKQEFALKNGLLKSSPIAKEVTDFLHNFVLEQQEQKSKEDRLRIVIGDTTDALKSVKNRFFCLIFGGSIVVATAVVWVMLRQVDKNETIL